MLSFSRSYQIYHFTVNIGKAGRQALRQLQFALDYDSQRNYLKHHVSKLRDYINLQRVYIRLDHCMIKNLYTQKIDIWDWKGYSEKNLELLSQLPSSLELKILMGKLMG